MAIHRGEVYFVDLGSTVGHEQSGRRPVAVVSHEDINCMPLVVAVAPGTRGRKSRKANPTNVRVPPGEANLSEETVFLTFQVRALDHTRFGGPPLGRLSPEWMAKIDAALAYALSLAPAPSS